MSEKEKTLEESFEELDSVITQMQNGDLPLEETFALYKRGIELVEACSGKIEKVEADIRKITAADGQEA